ncbi:centrosomal protein of 44 kDa isoform X1 [Octodon degus]|nr:centrosomal protein of 44 kDa isoform X1 [Octodon degus]
MMATGDLKRSLRKLEQVLRLLNYPKEVDYVGLIKGDTAATLPIISYSLTSYSPYVTEHLMECNVELIAKNDLRFTDTVYKLLRDQFDYKPILSKKQFMQHGFAEWKIEIACDVLNCVMKKHKELSGVDKTSLQLRKKIISHSEPSSSNEKTPVETVGIDVAGRCMTSGKKKALVIRHLYNESDGNLADEETESSVTEDTGVCDVSDLQASEIKVAELQVPTTKAEEEDIKSNPEITALRTMLAECQEKLSKLTWIEKRLDSLEETMKGKVIVDEKTWTNLLSRITLLETEMLLSKKNEYVEFNVVSDNYAASSDVDLVTLDGKVKEESLAHVPPSSGYSTESTNSTPRASTITYCGLNDVSE